MLKGFFFHWQSPIPASDFDFAPQRVVQDHRHQATTSPTAVALSARARPVMILPVSRAASCPMLKKVSMIPKTVPRSPR